MSSFALLVLCLQACLLQSVYSRCLGGDLIGPAYGGYLGGCNGYLDGYPGDYYGGYLGGCGGYLDGYPGGYFGRYGGACGLDSAYGIGFAGPLAYGYDAYGGEGIGDVAVIGSMPVAGTTLVEGQVPILGAVEFAGLVSAAGSVTITGSCGCGCRGGYLY
ncbi:chorion class CA protein ERA.1-like [Maniola hyperantus]|uniref:chorion class CA protein ERA.1-like n=1 Tax=Aphantopus hyperantus TaxID=2795564 RepID=UPI00374A521B